MNYIIKSRGLGKTSDLIKLCYANKGVIITTTRAQKRYIHEYLCPKMNIPASDVKVLLYDSLRGENIDENTPIYIDDFPYLLQDLLQKQLCSSIKIDTIAGTLN